MRIGSEQKRTLQWINDAEGSAVRAPKNDQVLMALVRKGLLSRSRSPEMATPADLLAFGKIPGKAKADRGWHEFKITPAGKEVIS